MCDVLRDFVPFVQFEKREKHSWRIVTFSIACNLLKVTLLHVCFSRFLYYANGTKLRNASQQHLRHLNEASYTFLLYSSFLFLLLLSAK